MIIKEIPQEYEFKFSESIQVEQKKELNIIKEKIIEECGSYDISIIEYLSKVMFCSPKETIRIIEQNFSNEIRLIKELSLHLGIKIEDIIYTEQEKEELNNL